MTDSSINVIIADTPDGAKNYVTLTSARITFSARLTSEAIVGLLKRPQEPIASLNFMANSAFRRFLADVIARNGRDDPDMQAEAARQRESYIAIIDQRTPMQGGRVPSEDIIRNG